MAVLIESNCLNLKKTGIAHVQNSDSYELNKRRSRFKIPAKSTFLYCRYKELALLTCRNRNFGDRSRRTSPGAEKQVEISKRLDCARIATTARTLFAETLPSSYAMYKHPATT